ncbi:Solute carrier family 35 member G1 [Orchesella cincta]|uniref:Solute carrier family 35 member G1 n=1 Tax=Orchesella cincta TaxID=48709 RepID=A0A1D2N6L3_ORCCI|nr:Solute carrier family 35 member G1 [Orchesella cincta]
MEKNTESINMGTTEATVFLPVVSEDDNGNEVKECSFSPPTPSEHPYKSYKLVEVVPEAVDNVDKASAKCACTNYLGIFWTLGSGFIFTVGGVIVKYMKDYHPITLATFRFQGVLLPALVLALYSHYVRKEVVFGTIWPLTDKEKLKRFAFTCVRGVLGATALILLFYAIQTLTLADALVISSCRPVFVTFVAHVFLGEPCGVFPVFAALLTVVGVGVIARPPILTGDDSFDTETLMGAGYAFVGMLTAAVSMVVLRYLRGVHVSMVTLTFGMWGTLISGIGSTIIERFDVPTTAEHIVLALCLAAATFFAQVGITIAMKYEQAGAVAIVRSCDTIFAFVLQFLILGTVPDLFSLIGAVLIISCVLMIAFRKWVSTLPEKHSARKRYWFVLK